MTDWAQQISRLEERPSWSSSKRAASSGRGVAPVRYDVVLGDAQGQPPDRVMSALIARSDFKLCGADCSRRSRTRGLVLSARAMAHGRPTRRVDGRDGLQLDHIRATPSVAGLISDPQIDPGGPTPVTTTGLTTRRCGSPWRHPQPPDFLGTDGDQPRLLGATTAHAVTDRYLFEVNGAHTRAPAR